MPAECDLITLHAPGGTAIVDAAWLASARPGLVLVNTARPDLVDEEALAARPAERRRSAGSPPTPSPATRAAWQSRCWPPTSPTACIVTPHFGAQTVEAVDGMGSLAVANVLAVLAGATPPHPVPSKG